MKTKILSLFVLFTFVASVFADRPTLFRGEGTPNAVVTANTGDIYTGMTLGQLWIKTGGYNNTGWVQLVLNSNLNVLITKAQGIGYSTGSGGVVTQLTSVTTGVTLNKPTGVITTRALSNAAGTEIAFTVTDSFVDVSDSVVVSPSAYAGTGTLLCYVRDVSAGSFTLCISNLHASAALNALAVINFSVYKGSAN